MKARDNPFGAARVLAAIRYASTAGDFNAGAGGAASLLSRLAALGYRAAIVGPHGSGKTTLLEDLERLLPPRGFHVVHLRLDSDERRLPRSWRLRARHLEAGDIVCLDGAEQLGSIDWMWFRWRTRRAGGVIITSHRQGRLPTLIACTTSPGLLAGIIRRLAPDGLPAAPPAADLFARHRGNLREALRELYDVYAAAPDPGPDRIGSLATPAGLPRVQIGPQPAGHV